MQNTKIYVPDVVQKVRTLYDGLLNFRPGVTMIDYISAQAECLLKARKNHDDTVCFQVSNWHPDFIGAKKEIILSAAFSAEDAFLTLAKEYGYADSADLQSRGSQTPNLMFEEAVDLLIWGKNAELRGLLERHPELATERSTFGHGCTLLHYVGSNGVETFRQIVPENLADVTQLLVKTGADVNAKANVYGGSLTLGLLLSSAHPKEAGVCDEVARVLRAAGAREN